MHEHVFVGGDVRHSTHAVVPVCSRARREAGSVLLVVATATFSAAAVPHLCCKWQQGHWFWVLM